MGPGPTQTPLLCLIPALLRLGRAAGLPGAAPSPGSRRGGRGEARIRWPPGARCRGVGGGAGGEAPVPGGRRAQRCPGRGGGRAGCGAELPLCLRAKFGGGAGARRCPGTCRGPGGHSALAARRQGPWAPRAPPGPPCCCCCRSCSAPRRPMPPQVSPPPAGSLRRKPAPRRLFPCVWDGSASLIALPARAGVRLRPPPFWRLLHRRGEGHRGEAVPGSSRACRNACPAPGMAGLPLTPGGKAAALGRAQVRGAAPARRVGLELCEPAARARALSRSPHAARGWGALGNAAPGAAQCPGSVRGAGSSRAPLLALGGGGRSRPGVCGWGGGSARGHTPGLVSVCWTGLWPAQGCAALPGRQAVGVWSLGVRVGCLRALRLFSSLSFGCR